MGGYSADTIDRDRVVHLWFSDDQPREERLTSRLAAGNIPGLRRVEEHIVAPPTSGALRAAEEGRHDRILPRYRPHRRGRKAVSRYRDSRAGRARAVNSAARREAGWRHIRWVCREPCTDRSDGALPPVTVHFSIGRPLSMQF